MNFVIIVVCLLSDLLVVVFPLIVVKDDLEIWQSEGFGGLFYQSKLKWYNGNLMCLRSRKFVDAQIGVDLQIVSVCEVFKRLVAFKIATSLLHLNRVSCFGHFANLNW